MLDGARNNVHSSTYYPFAPLSELPPHFLGNSVGGIVLLCLFIYSYDKAEVSEFLHLRKYRSESGAQNL